MSARRRVAEKAEAEATSRPRRPRKPLAGSDAEGAAAEPRRRPKPADDAESADETG